MLSLFRLRALPVLRLSPRAPGSLSASLRTPLRAISSTRPTLAATWFVVFLDYQPFFRHLRKQCREPTICVACGVEGHQRRDCPSPDPARLQALKTAPIRCFRCGEDGHAIKDCTKPQTCYGCKQPVTADPLSRATAWLNVPPGRVPPGRLPPRPPLPPPQTQPFSARRTVVKIPGGAASPTPGAHSRVPDPCTGLRRFLSARCVFGDNHSSNYIGILWDAEIAQDQVENEFVRLT
ncbi:hypothetical protein C8R44DRAFT_741560 [Mycena epipterygia]|nr:hypothetical protein C8R44DRAFT_741560 [Mycena epipterygia]